jgi:hypothetical protein
MLWILTREALLEATWRRHRDGRGCHRRQCLACGSDFFTSRPEARYCCASCRQRAYRGRLRLRAAGVFLTIEPLDITVTEDTYDPRV